MSVGAGIAQGLKEGAALGTMLVNQEEQRKDRATARTRADQTWQQQQEDRTRRMGREDKTWADQDLDREWTLTGQEEAEHAKQGQALIDNYKGIGNVPKEELEAWKKRGLDIDSRRRSVYEKRNKPALEKEKNEAVELFAGAKDGRVDLSTIDDAKLYRYFGLAFGRDPLDYTDGKITQAANNLISQMETQAPPEQLARDLNVLLERELREGVGTPGRGGHPIVRKEIMRVDMLPNGKILPTLGVTVRLPDGSEKTYPAPVTKGRTSSDDDDEVTTLDMGEGLDYVGKQAAMAEALRNPAMAEKLKRGAQAERERLMNDLGIMARYGVRDYKPKVTRETTQAGGQIIQRTYEDDKLTKEEKIEKTLDPNTEARVAAQVQTAGMRVAARDEDRIPAALKARIDAAQKELDRAASTLATAEAEVRKRPRPNDALLSGVADAKKKEAEARQKLDTLLKQAEAPAAGKAPAAAPGKKPDIKAVKGAPTDSTIGGFVSGKGWEVKDKSGKTIGYVRE